MSDGTIRAAGEDEYYRGAALYQQGRLLEAEQVLRWGIERHREETRRQGAEREHPWCHSLLGAVLAETRRDRKSLDEAEEHLRRAAEVAEFDDPGIVRNLALFLLQKRRDPTQAEQVLRQAIGRRRHHQTFAVLGYVLEVEGRWTDARSQYLEAIIRPPTLIGHLAEDADLWRVQLLESQAQAPDGKTLALECLRSRYLAAIAGRPRPPEERTLWDWNLGYWYAAAIDGFARTSSKLYERMQTRPLRWLSYVLLGLLLVGSASPPASISPYWLPVLTWTEWTQVALVVAAVTLWLLPHMLHDARVRKLQLGPLGVEFEPRMGP